MAKNSDIRFSHPHACPPPRPHALTPSLPPSNPPTLQPSAQARFSGSDPEVVAKARGMWDAHMEDPSGDALPSDLKVSVYKLVLKSGGEVRCEKCQQFEWLFSR